MKRLTALFFSLTMALGLAACGSGASSQAAAPSSAPASPASSQAASSEAAPSEAASSETASSAVSSEAASSSDAGQADPAEQSAGNTLVVYYSATGNTEEAAGYIASITGADVSEIVPADPYTSEDLTWTDPESRVSIEHDARVAGETVTVELTQTTPDNWDSYDTVFIGYPIWWGEAAWPVDTFVQSNDFTGKTVIPFCTSASSDLGESGQLLAELAGAGDWMEGQRFRSSVSESDVQTWLDELDL